MLLRLNTAHGLLMLTRVSKKVTSVVICFTWMACASLHHVQAALSVLPLFLFCLGVRVCVCVWKCAWRPGEWSVEDGGGYLWFISDHSSKNTVDAASLSHPLCPSHCFSIGLPPSCCWHPGKLGCQRCPRCHRDPDPIAATCTDCLPRAWTERSVSLSSIGPTQRPRSPASCLLCGSWSHLASKSLRSTQFHTQHDWYR